MATPPFVYQEMFPMGEDTTKYRLLTKDYVSVSEFEGKPILKVEPEGLRLLAETAWHDVAFYLRPEHLKMVQGILSDPEASENDKSVALTMLRNAEVAALGVLPLCQDTGTAICVGKKGQQVWTGFDDAEYISRGAYDCYTKNNLRYSQNVALDMYKEINTGTNLPAQIDLFATDHGMDYSFLFIAKGGGSANKTYLYQETKALLNPTSLKKFMVEKMSTLGTAACPPYHVAFVVGGTSAELCLKTVKLASTKYYDSLPTSGNEHGRAFRDVELENELKKEAEKLGLGASSAASGLRWMCAWCVCRVTVLPARWRWAYPALPTATPRPRLPRRVSLSRSWSTTRASTSPPSTAKPRARVCRLIWIAR